MNKRDLLLEVNKRGFHLTDDALRTYTSKSKKYQLITPISSKAGVSHQYTEEHVEQICEIIAVKRLGIPLSQMKTYLSASDKNQYLLNHIRTNKRSFHKKSMYWRYLEQISDEIAEGKHKTINAIDLYHNMGNMMINQDCKQMNNDFKMDMLIEVSNQRFNVKQAVLGAVNSILENHTFEIVFDDTIEGIDTNGRFQIARQELEASAIERINRDFDDVIIGQVNQYITEYFNEATINSRPVKISYLKKSLIHKAQNYKSEWDSVGRKEYFDANL